MRLDTSLVAEESNTDSARGSGASGVDPCVGGDVEGRAEAEAKASVKPRSMLKISKQ